MKPSIMLSSGEYFDFENPDPNVMTLEVIAGSLSKQCRYTGHVSRFYSVAEHCVRASFIVPEEDALEALMHDAAEAFIVDLPSPLKVFLPEYKKLEQKVDQLVAEQFGLRYPWPDSVKHADLVMLATEKRDLMPAGNENWAILEGIEPLEGNLEPLDWLLLDWEQAFITRFEDLAR